MDHSSLREALIAAARSLQKHQLGTGTAGNLSARVEQGYLITPTGVDYELVNTCAYRQNGLAGQPGCGRPETIE